MFKIFKMLKLNMTNKTFLGVSEDGSYFQMLDKDSTGF